MYVFIIVGEAELSSLVQSSLTAEGEYLRITGRNDRLLYECGAAETYGGYPDPEFSGEAFAFREEDGAFVAEYRLEGTGWRVLSVRPYAEIARNLRRMSRNIWGFVALSFAVGAGVAAFFSLRKTAPVMSLLRDNRAMEEQLEAQKPLLLNTFLERLLTREHRGGGNCPVRRVPAIPGPGPVAVRHGPLLRFPSGGGGRGGAPGPVPQRDAGGGGAVLLSQCGVG